MNTVSIPKGSTLPHWSLIVEFETHEGKEDDLAALLGDSARRSLAEEEGCVSSLVLRPVNRDGTSVPGRVIASAVYASEAALAAHESKPRPGLSEALRTLTTSRRVVYAVVAGTEQPQSGLAPSQLNASNDG